MSRISILAGMTGGALALPLVERSHERRLISASSGRLSDREV